jgi:uncharacterized protein
MTTQEIDRVTFGRQWEQWHAEHERKLADPHGFLAITTIRWVGAQPERYDDAPGSWVADDSGVTVTLDDGEELVVDGTPVRGSYRFGVIPERGGRLAAFGDAVVEVAKRGGRHIVRPRHPEHSLRTSFRGVPAYAPDPAWALTGRFLPFDPPRDVTVGAVVEGLHHVYQAPGRIEFHLGTETFHLTAFNGRVPGSLLVLFTDLTSGVTTYPANRALAVDAPDETGIVTVDFNRATNLPCAYTDLATCPLPPTENRLPIAVEAGEKMPHERS